MHGSARFLVTLSNDFDEKTKSRQIKYVGRAGVPISFVAKLSEARHELSSSHRLPRPLTQARPPY